MSRRTSKGKRQRTPRAAESGQRRSARLWATVLALAALAGGFSAYLTYAYYKVRDGSGWQSICEVNARFSCDAVAASPFSSLAGLPISWFAVVFYGAVAWLAWRTLRGHTWVLPRSPALALAGVGAAASAASLLLAIVSGWLIGVFCPLCLVLYAVNAGLLALGIVALRRGSESFRDVITAEVRALRGHVGRVAATGVLGLALLGALPLVRSVQPPLDNLCEYAGAKRSRGDASMTSLVVFTDYQCPFCRKADAALDGVRATSGFEVTSRNYPLDQSCNPTLKRTIHPGACEQASAVICAEDRSVEYGRRVFENGAKDRASLTRLAVELGLNVRRFEACLSSPETAARLADDVAAARDAGVQGTPTLFVDGRRYTGRIDSSTLACLAADANYGWSEGVESKTRRTP